MAGGLGLIPANAPFEPVVTWSEKGTVSGKGGGAVSGGNLDQALRWEPKGKAFVVARMLTGCGHVAPKQSVRFRAAALADPLSPNLVVMRTLNA